MFIRRKANKSGTTSVQIVSKQSGKYKVLRSVGVAKTEAGIIKLEREAESFISELTGQTSIDFPTMQKEVSIKDFFLYGDLKIKQVGPERILGPLFDEIGFGAVKYKLFRHLVLGRVCFPGSKLKTARYLSRYLGITFPVGRIYRFMDKLEGELQAEVEEISIKHTKSLFEGDISMVFYDVTTIYFETSEPDEWRMAGFSKDGKHQNPQLLLGLLVSEGGYPLAYSLYEGNSYEGNTLIPVLEDFKKRLNLSNITVIADSGLLSKQNIVEIEKLAYSFIIGARLKNESSTLKDKIIALPKTENLARELLRSDGKRLIVSWSQARAKKDAHNREKGLEKLRKACKSEKLTKAQINQRGYNRFLALEGELKVIIDEQKVAEDAKWDGLKGYITNTQLSEIEVIGKYNQLWSIEKAFRISKTDLKIRPVYHRLQRRIKAHVCISFCAYKLYKEMERQLKLKGNTISIEQAIELLQGIMELEVTLPQTGEIIKRIMSTSKEQNILLENFSKII